MGLGTARNTEVQEERKHCFYDTVNGYQANICRCEPRCPPRKIRDKHWKNYVGRERYRRVRNVIHDPALFFCRERPSQTIEHLVKVLGASLLAITKLSFVEYFKPCQCEPMIFPTTRLNTLLKNFCSMIKTRRPRYETHFDCQVLRSDPLPPQSTWSLLCL